MRPARPAFAATTPRSLAARELQNPGALPAISDLWTTGQTLAEASAPSPDPSLRLRIRIIRTDLKYPLIRLEETFRRDDQTGADILIQQIAMVADHMVVKLTPGSNASEFSAAVTSAGASIRSLKPASRIYLITIPAPLAINGLPDAIDTLKALSGLVRIAEPDFIVHASLLPNDASFAQLYGLHNTGQTGGTTDADIDAPEAWEITTGSRAVRVGIIDTGIDYTHPDLAANIWTNPAEIAGNGIDDDGNGYIDDVRGWDFVNNDADPMDDHYHGTHCAGTIGGVGNNGSGVAGVNWQVSLVGLKFLSSSGSGTTSDAVEAVSYANGLGLDLTSNSWGGGGFSQALYDAIAAANTAGHLFIAAAGNSARNTDPSPNYPSGYDLPNIIAVAATDHADQLATFSNYGIASVDLAAPGVNTVSTSPGNTYRTLSGTSMATPHVAGAAALLLSRQPGLAAPELKAALLNSVDLLPALSGRVLTQGRLNVASALASLSGLGVSPATGWSVAAQIGGTLPATATTFTLRNGGTAPFSWTASSNVPWADVSLASGTLAPGATATVIVSLDTAAAILLPYGTHDGAITFANTADNAVLRRNVRLVLDPLTVSVFSETFEASSLDSARWTITGGANARTVVSTANLPHGGTRHLVMDAITDGTYARNEATLRLDLSGRSDLRLTFWAKGFNEEPNGPPSSPFTNGADFDGVAISADGVTWYEIQPLRSLSADWQKYTVDLDAALASRGLTYNSDFRIRFNQYDNYAVPTDGIAIDDIAIVRIINKRLGLVSPATLPEGGVGTATLTAAPPPESELVVTLADASSTLVLPATVTLAAGQSSIDFTVSAPEDTLRNGTRSPVISATTPGWAGAESTTRVLDNETATLGLVLPVSATEGSTALTGTVSVSPAPNADITVELSSDDTGELRVPATTIIPAGQTSATFELLVVDDNRIDGTTHPAITARIDNWTPASASLAIHDNDTSALFVSAPASVREGASNFTATITLSGTLATPLTVVLSTDDTTELAPPAEVVIPAGQLSASVSVTILNDTLQDGPQTVRLIASAPAFTTGETSLIVQDNDAHHLRLSAAPATVLRNQAVAFVLSGEDIADQVVPDYSSDLSLSAVDAVGNPVTLSPASVAASAFVSGKWNGSVTFSAYATGVRITITDTAGRSVTSDAFDVTAGPAASFIWNNPPATVTVDTPFPATVSAVDAAGNPAVSFSGNVALSVQDNDANVVRILSWVGYADTSPSGKYERTKQAIRNQFTAFTETSTTVTSASALESALADKHVFLVPVQEYDYSYTLTALGSAWASVLQGFVSRGGTVIACSVSGAEHQFLGSSGLMNASKAYVSTGSHPVFKQTSTWLNEGVPTSFTAYSVSTYTSSNGQPALYSMIYGYPVVLSRTLGTGRVVLIGTDYTQVGTGMDRIIANAVRANKPADISMRVPVRPASATFTAGAWSGPLSVPISGSNLSLRADTPDPIKGVSTAFASVTYTPPSGTGLVIAAPASIAEAAGTVTATVSRASASASPLEITLTSGSPAEITVPPTITIPAGATSASFTLTINDDTLIDGDRDVVVSASAAGPLVGSSTVRVLDDESGTLTLTAPATIAENTTTAIGTLAVNPPAARSLTVTLTSGTPSAATVPATVIVPAGYPSVTFPITPVNDTAIDGDQTTVITAALSGWPSATRSITVTDNEQRTLTLTGATSLEEGDTASVTLGLSGTLPTDLAVSLSSANPAQLTVPATVTIPAGQTSISFQIRAVEDATQNGSRTIQISASADTFTGATRDIVVRDDELHHFAFSAIPDGRGTHTPIAVTITAQSSDNVAITGYTGTAALSAQAANGDPITFTPANTGAFVNGVWTGGITATTTGLGVRVTATDGTATGQSNAFDILGAPRISVAPASISVDLHRDESTTRTVVISNSGQQPLTWSVSGINASGVESFPEPLSGPVFADGVGHSKDSDALSDAAVYDAPRPDSDPSVSASWAPRLETVLATLDAGHTAVRALIPGRYAFTDGVTGTYISDGGNDMYDGGNYLATDLGTALPYSDGVILSSAKLGAGGRYFTRKYDGLFVFAADLAGVSYFEITGNLGADGFGSTDTAILTQTRAGTTYRGFVKRVYGTNNSSVNHLVIVADNGSVTHSASTDTNNDLHRVSSLSGVTRIYHLLYAGGSGGYINNTSTQAVMAAFLDTVSTGDWMNGAPTSGTIAPGASATVTLTFDSTGLDFRTHTQTLRITSNDPLQPVTDVPVSLTVTDRVLHHFEFDPIPAQIRGAPFTVRLRALSADGFPVFSHASAVALTANGATLTPANTTTQGWEDGVWTGQATVTTFGTGITLTANDGAGHVGLSNAFDVGSGPATGFTWDNIPSPQIVDTPFPAVLRATDAGGNPVAGYSGTANLSALVPLTLPNTGTDYSINNYPFASSLGAVVRQQVIYPASSLGGQPRHLVGLSLKTPYFYSVVSFNQWTIRLKTTTRTHLSGASFDPDGWTTVHVSNATISAVGWVTFAFSIPFDYNGTDALLVDFSFRNPATGSSYADTSVSYDSSAIRSIRQTSSSASADPFSFTTATGSNYAPVIRFTSLEPTPLRPATATLVNGAWNGDVSLASAGTPIQLRAKASSPELSGDSNTFTVSPPAIPPPLPFSETWESGAPSPAWTLSGTNSSRTQITTENTPHGGTRHLTLDSTSSSPYSRNEATLTLDLAGRTGVVLSFWAKGFNEGSNAPSTNPFTNGADFDGVAISADGITWYEVQPLRSPALSNAWQLFTVNLDTALSTYGLAYTSAFRIRFNRYGNDYIPYDGIALDDIAVTTSATGVTTLTLPATAAESAAPLSGTLSLAVSRSTDTIFTLSSSAAAKLSLPATITLPAGQTSLTFTATPINDALFDGSHTVTVTATPPAGSGLFAGTTTLTITDDDAPAITLTVTPSSISESASAATATVTLGAVPSASIVLTLASSDPTAATVPASLSFEPGQTTATFLVTPVNDTKIDGPQTTTLSAALAGAAPGTATFTVTDNETTALSLSSTSSITEGNTSTRSISISGTLTEPLTISLSSTNSAQLTVPSTITIPAGSTSASFTLTAVDDTNTDGTVTVQITATASGFTGASANVSVVDNDLHHFTFSTISSPQIANRPFTVFAYARTIDESSVTYTGTVPLSAEAAGGSTVSLTPATLTFSGSSASASLSILAPASGVTLRLDDGAGHTGASNSFDVGTGAINRFHVSPLAPHQSAGVPASVTLTAQDSYGNTLTSFNGSASLSAGPVPTITGTGTTNTNSFPIYSYSEDSRTQIIYTPAEIGSAGPISSLALNVLTTPGQVLSNWTIRMKHVSSATASAWESTGWTTVHQSSADLITASPGWIEFPFTTPFNYDGTSYLMIDLSYNNTGATSVRAGVVQTTYTASPRLIYANTSSTAGDPLSWTGTTPTVSTNNYLPNLRLSRPGSLPVTPETTPAFTAGTWTGPVTFATTSASTIALQARNGNTLGQSNLFDVLPPPLISVSPEETWTLSGPRGGDFTSQTRTYTLTNISAASIAWTASSPVAWLAFAPTGGTLAPGAAITVTASPTSAASALASGINATDLIFAVDGVPNAIRRAELTATPAGALSLSSESGFAPVGLVGGPFSPSSASWTLSNTGDATISWTASKTQPWLSLSTTGGSLAPGSTATVTATLGASAGTLPVSIYTDTITFTNTTTGQGNATRNATLTVRAPLPPAITQQPANATVGPMANATLNLTATGDGALSYQWYRGNAGNTASPISGATGPLLITPPLNTTGTFWARVTNYVGTADTATVTVTVQTVALQNLKAFGDNSGGGLGDGTTIARITPVQAASNVIGIAAGQYYTRFLKTDGTLWGVGYNKYGQLGDGSTTDRSIAVQIATGVVQSASGSFHSVFVKADGTFWGSGNNGNGELGDSSSNQRLTPIQIATGVVQASTGANYTMFIKTDGTLWATGYNSYSQLGDGTATSRSTPIQVSTGVAQVSAGWYQTLFVKTDGTLWAMGDNSSGQLGDGTTTRRTTPVQIATGVRQVATGAAHTLFIKNDGTLWAMGSNSYGQLGDGTTIQRIAPVQIASGVSYVSAAYNHTLFVKTDGILWAMGHNGSGQLGDGTTTARYTPVQVGSAVTTISAGYQCSLFLSQKPSIISQTVSVSAFAGQPVPLSVDVSGPPTLTYQWYVGTSGNTAQPLIDATSAAFTTPPLTATTDYWVRISNGSGSVDSSTLTATICVPPVIATPPASMTTAPGRTAVISVSATGGNLSYQWYRGSSGDTSNPIAGATNPTVVTQPVTATTSFWARITNIAGSIDSPAATITTQAVLNLKLMAMGVNTNGQLGDGSTTSRITPVQTASGVGQVSAGINHTLLAKTDGTLWTAGLNTYGQLGDGSFTQRISPIQVASSVSQIASGSYHSLFTKTNGTLWAMGLNTSGQLGDGSVTNRSSPIQVSSAVTQVSAGDSHTLFIKTDGTLWAMGSNSFGQLGDGTTIARSNPVQITSGVADVSAGNSHTLFLKTNGTLWAMGYNFAGQMGDGSLFNRLTPVQVASSVVQIAAGSHFSLFLKADGTLWGMGYNSGGPLGDGTTTSHPTPVQIASGVSRIAAGGYHTLFIKTDGSLWAIGSNSSGQLGNGTTTDRYYPIQIALGVTDVSLGDYYSFFLQSPPPVIITSPLSQGVPQGQTVTLTAAATSPIAVSYQWYAGTSGTIIQPIAGATAASFTTPPINSPSFYWVRVSNVIGSTDSTTATLTLLPPPDTDTDGLPDAWETTHGLNSGASSADNGRLGDPDHDGIPNLLEYAMGLDPKSAETQAPTTSTTETNPETGQTHLVYTYRRLIYPGAVTYTVTTSTNLTAWSAPAVAPEVLSTVANPDGLTETVTLRLNPALGTGRVFVRVQVDTP